MILFLITIFLISKIQSFRMMPDLYSRNMYSRRHYVKHNDYLDLSSLNPPQTIEKDKITSEQFKEYIRNFKYLVLYFLSLHIYIYYHI